MLHIRSAQKAFAAGADLDLLRSWKDAPSPGKVLSGMAKRISPEMQGLALYDPASLADVRSQLEA